MASADAALNGALDHLLDPLDDLTEAHDIAPPATGRELAGALDHLLDPLDELREEFESGPARPDRVTVATRPYRLAHRGRPAYLIGWCVDACFWACT
jgi:hypothetical protein